jgi:hypothetical protein
MKKKCSLITRLFLTSVLFLTIFQQNIFAQKLTPHSVVGTITNDKGELLQGVVVEVKNSNTKAITDASGKFSISIKEKTAVLVITSTGYIDKDVMVNETITKVDVVLAVDTKALEDVVVIGYATVKKRDVTGAVSGINQKDIKSRPVTNAIEAMQGKVAGVDISSNMILNGINYLVTDVAAVGGQKAQGASFDVGRPAGGVAVGIDVTAQQGLQAV